jgi:hypothetical protein
MFTDIIYRFSIPGTFVKAERFGPGLINDTYLCDFEEAGALRKYILQRINKSVFRSPEQVMRNVELVTDHIQDRLRREGVADPERVTPALVKNKTGGSFHLDAAGEYWRMFHFIETGEVFDTVQGPEHAYEVGRGLGKFHAQVADLKPETLYETIVGFHHTPGHLSEYDDALRRDVKQRAAAIGAETEFVSRRRSLAPLLTDLVNSGQIPVRVAHNDPKVNNVMMRRDTREALCMLDLDTVMPGIVHFDFGDCARSAANPAGEDAEDLAKVAIDGALFEAVASGYLREAGAFLLPKEIEMLAVSVKVITFELGLRFLADYLRGDTYFKIKHPSHNLRRARVQFKLLESIEAMEKQMIALVLRFSSRR